MLEKMILQLQTSGKRITLDFKQDVVESFPGIHGDQALLWGGHQHCLSPSKAG